MGIYLVLYEGWTADAAYRPLQSMKPFKPFRDASCGACSFNLGPLDCLRAVERARDVGLIDFHTPGSRWDIDDYEFYEQVRGTRLLQTQTPYSRSWDIDDYEFYEQVRVARLLPTSDTRSHRWATLAYRLAAKYRLAASLSERPWPAHLPRTPR